MYKMIKNIKGWDKPQRIVVVERTMRFLMAYNPEYMPVPEIDGIEFHLNQSCHCACNEIASLHHMHVTDKNMPCGCFTTECRVIKEADPEDFNKYPRAFPLPEDIDLDSCECDG